MNGAGGLAGWRWVGRRPPIQSLSPPRELTTCQVFILEGLPAILMGIYTFFFLPDCESPPRELSLP